MHLKLNKKILWKLKRKYFFENWKNGLSNTYTYEMNVFISLVNVEWVYDALFVRQEIY